MATSRLYGESDAQRTRALSSADPLRLPWISASLERVAEVLADLTGVCVTPPTR